MALGVGLGVNIGNPLESKTGTTGGTTAIPFMMTSDRSVNSYSK